MRESAGRHWSTSSALADELVSSQGLSYRAAHDAVARLITAHEQAGEPPGVVHPRLAGEHFVGYSRQQLASLLDAHGFVESRTSAGGTSAERRKELAAEAAKDLEGHEQAVAALTTGVERARARLLREARELVDPQEP